MHGRSDAVLPSCIAICDRAVLSLYWNCQEFCSRIQGSVDKDIRV